VPALPVVAPCHRGAEGYLPRLLNRVGLAGGEARAEGEAMSKHRFMHAVRPMKLAAPSGESAREGWPVSGATPEHLAAINALPGVLKPLTAADVFVRECDAINDQPLKNWLKLGVPELAQIAQMSPGAGIHVQHDTWTSDGLPLGRIFAARLETRGEAAHVVQTFYLVADDDNAKTVGRIDAGAISEVSVSFLYDRLTCSICQTGLSECAHWPGEEYDGQSCLGLVQGVDEYLETSLVWQGMANDTRIRMAASRQALTGDSDLADYFAGKPKESDLAALFRPVPLDALFKSEPLEMLFTK
jgi:hypothetical protein